MPPSPGLDTVAVLRDAVAARTRHRVRDAVLLVLLVALAVLDPVAVVLWMVAAVVGRRLLASRPRAGEAGELFSWAAALALLLLVALLKAGTGVGVPWGDRTWWPSLAIVASIYAVLVGDIWLVRTYLRRRFQSHSFVADHTRAGSAVERRLRGLGLRRYATQLERFAAAEEHSAQAAGAGDIVVHRGDTPFVGAGYVLPTQSIPSRAPSGRRSHGTAGRGQRARAVRPGRGRAGAAGRRGTSTGTGGSPRSSTASSSSSPSSSSRTGATRRSAAGCSVTPCRPVRRLPVDEVRAIAAEQLEWARYYSCFRRESWSRNLVTSSTCTSRCIGARCRST